MQIVQHPSPNCGPRRDGLRPELIVIHYTAMHSAAAALARLCDPAAEVSAHYLISGQGKITQLVQEDQRAWHAGAGSWAGAGDVNSRSVGIELDHRGTHPFAAAQMAALETLLPDIMGRWDIPTDGVIGHSDMAPGRKIDPGPRFDWARLERQEMARKRGQGTPTNVTWDSFCTAAAHVGYPVDVADDVLLETVRLRYRPWASGALVAADIAPLL